MSTTVPKISWESTGLNLPEESAILAGTRDDINAAFGKTLNPNPDTPQGQFAASLAAIIADANDVFAYFVNQVNPDFSDGFMQDGIGRIYYLNRKPAVATTVTCQCVGAEGTSLPSGSKVTDGDGNIYVSLESAVIPVGGSIDVQFQNVVAGAIPAAAETVTTIYQVVGGWDSVTNADPGVIGSEAESRADFEMRRSSSVAVNSNGSLQSIYGNVFLVDEVLDVYASENHTGAAKDIGSTDYEMLPHSIYVAVQGGDSQDIAEAIWTYKAPGADYNGDTTVTVVDESGYDFPYPTYSVTFQRPDPLPVLFAVRIVDNPKLPSDIVSKIKDAVVSAFEGQDGGSRARIGSEIVAGRFYSGVAAISPYVSILSILLGTTTATLTSVTPGVDQFPTIDPEDITVTLV